MIFIGLQKSPLFIDMCIARCLAIRCCETPIWPQERQAATRPLRPLPKSCSEIFKSNNEYIGIPWYTSIYPNLWPVKWWNYVKLMKKKLFRNSLAWVTTVRSSFFLDSLAARVWSQYKFINSSSMFNMTCFSMLHIFHQQRLAEKWPSSHRQGERQQRGSSRPSLVVWLTGDGMAE